MTAVFCSAIMGYFSRPRALSKPTRAEVKELNYHLARRSAHELHLICQIAASQSPEVASMLMKVMKDSNLITEIHSGH